MNPAPNEPAPNDPLAAADGRDGDLLAQRCMQYLLGELSASEVATLENELRTSPAVSREMLLQSELLCFLADAQRSDIRLPSRAATPSPAFPALARNWVLMIATLAACLAVAIVGFYRLRDPDRDAARLAATHRDTPGRRTQGDEALLIARAWAASQSSEVSDEDWGVSEAEVDFVTDQPADEDAFLDWIVVAVAADAKVQSTQPGAESET